MAPSLKSNSLSFYLQNGAVYLPLIPAVTSALPVLEVGCGLSRISKAAGRHLGLVVGS